MSLAGLSRASFALALFGPSLLLGLAPRAGALGTCAPPGVAPPQLSIRPDGSGGLELLLRNGPSGAEAFIMGVDSGIGTATPARPLLPACAGQVRGELLQTLTLDGSGGFLIPLGPSGIAADRPELSVLCLPVGGSLLDSVVSNSVRFEPRSGDTSFQSGRVVVNEFMKDPTAVGDTHGEWIELLNLESAPVDVEGWSLSDDGSDSTWLDNGGAGLFIPAQGMLVLGRDPDPTTNGGVNIDHVITGMTLSNGDDEILLWTPNGVQSDAVRYDDGVNWPDDAGMAVALDPNHINWLLNDVGSFWCSSATPLVSGGPDTGTPGGANDTCP